MKYSFILILLFLNSISTTAQDTLETSKIYKVSPKYELTSGLLLALPLSIGFKEVAKISYLSTDDIRRLNPNDINRFDRSAAFKNPDNFATSRTKSDFYLKISLVTPFLLMADRQIRQDWLDLTSMYLITHTFDNALYFAATFPIRRPRPLAYNPQISVEDRAGDGKSLSFFSGHVSFASTSTFFFVKVFTDYHQIKGLKRVGLYTLASIPPALVGHYRIQAGKHFRTDVITGFVIGAVSGILVPEWHKKNKKHKKVSLYPVYDPHYGGLSANWTF